eukprot:5734030-Pleurochrysis_carterae.AAC.1
MGAAETCDEIGARSRDGRLVDLRPPKQFARQNSGDVRLWDFHPSLAYDQPTRRHTSRVHTSDRATESAPKSVIYGGTAIFYGAVRSGRQGDPT